MITKKTPILFDLSGTMFQDYSKSSLLFFDIETTGFTADSSFLYLIGAVSWQRDSWVLCQWLSQDPQEEVRVLSAFLEFAKPYTQLVHFNGDRFDIPYLQGKCRIHHLPDHLSSILSRDLYRMIRPLKTLLKLPALNQRSLEEFLGIFREDPYNGGELISVYLDYVSNPTTGAEETLLLHNRNDLEGMLAILPILSYLAVQNGNFRTAGCRFVDDSLIIQGWLPIQLPQPFSYGNQWFYLTGQKDSLSIQVRGLRGTLKYFFPDYKNYYYLPEEDIAMHKSVAVYVDRAHREPAKASTCYNKKEGLYLPQFETIFKPVFKTDYHQKQMYFSCTEKVLQDKEQMNAYAVHLLSYL